MRWIGVAFERRSVGERGVWLRVDEKNFAKIFEKFAKSRRGGLQFYSARLNFRFRSEWETSAAERFGFGVFRRGF